MQFHILVFATFASLIAPFGGFFASGLKRTFKIKDFGDSIPGHGGMTDRMDCQFIMGFFAFMYYSSFIAVYKASVGGVIEQAINGLTPEQQMEVVKGLSKHLVNQGVIPSAVSLMQVAFPKRALSNHQARFSSIFQMSSSGDELKDQLFLPTKLFCTTSRPAYPRR